jgi:protoporphyrinogen IX oxidase
LLWQMGYHKDGWAIAKLLLVVGLSAVSGMMGGWLKAFTDDRNTRDAFFFRVMNEVPTVLMIVIVILVVVKPF